MLIKSGVKNLLSLLGSVLLPCWDWVSKIPMAMTVTMTTGL